MSRAASALFAARLRLPSPVEPLKDDRLRAAGVDVWLKRDDLIHPDVPGNKWRKLKYNLDAAARAGQRTLLTFGGAYSNHIRATAAAGHYCGFSTIGIIRGEEHLPLNPSLNFAVNHGMRLSYMSRADYRHKSDPEVLADLRRQFGEEIATGFDTICCACGTGATLAGIAAGLSERQRAIGFSVLKGGVFLERDVGELQQAAMYGIYSLAEQGVFRPGSRIIAVITGTIWP